MIYKNELQQLIDEINNISGFSTNQLAHYIALLKKGEDLLHSIKNVNQNPMLETWIDMAFEELNRELNQRLKNQLQGLSPEQQKSEFLYSRSAVTLIFTNILMQL
ncbi:MAG: hypothetical protein ACP5PZ_10210 [Bacteroidales bacterium]